MNINITLSFVWHVHFLCFIHLSDVVYMNQITKFGSEYDYE